LFGEASIDCVGIGQFPESLDGRAVVRNRNSRSGPAKRSCPSTSGEPVIRLAIINCQHRAYAATLMLLDHSQRPNGNVRRDHIAKDPVGAFCDPIEAHNAQTLSILILERESTSLRVR